MKTVDRIKELSKKLGPLGQLALQGLGDGGPGVPAAGEAHGLIDVGAAGEGVPDGPADAGGRPAEGLDLGGVVVGLILEHEEPVLLLSVHRGLDLDGAGVDLLALVQVPEDAPLFQGLGRQGAQVHKGLGPALGLLLPVDLPPGGLIGPIDPGRLRGEASLSDYRIIGTIKKRIK